MRPGVVAEATTACLARTEAEIGSGSVENKMTSTANCVLSPAWFKIHAIRKLETKPAVLAAESRIENPK